MTPTFHRAQVIAARALPLLGAAIVAWWIWSVICAYPASQWNETRLRAAFLIADAGPLYAPPDQGVIHTWMYGPATPLLHLPAILAGSPAGALLISAAINVAAALATPLLVLALFRDRLGPPARCMLGLVALAATPATTLLFLQADNLAVALTALGLLALDSPARPGPLRLWLAAAAVVVAATSKQIALVALPAQVVYLALTFGFKAGVAQILRGTLLALITGGVAVAVWGWSALWPGLVLIPARLPFRSDLWAATQELTPTLAALACAVALVAREASRGDRAARLVLCSTLCSLPLGIAAALRDGGAVNSIHAYPLALNAAIACAWLSLLPHSAAPGQAPRWRLPLAAALACAGFAACMAPRLLQIGTRFPLPNFSSLHEASALARRFPDEVWFPWHPVVSRYVNGAHYHDEDGLHVRQLARFYPSRAHVQRHLPSRWRISALKRGELDSIDWGVAAAMHAESGPFTRLEAGGWTLLAPSSPASIPSRRQATAPAGPPTPP